MEIHHDAIYTVEEYVPYGSSQQSHPKPCRSMLNRIPEEGDSERGFLEKEGSVKIALLSDGLTQGRGIESENLIEYSRGTSTTPSDPNEYYQSHQLDPHQEGRRVPLTLQTEKPIVIHLILPPTICCVRVSHSQPYATPAVAGLRACPSRRFCHFLSAVADVLRDGAIFGATCGSLLSTIAQGSNAIGLYDFHRCRFAQDHHCVVFYSCGRCSSHRRRGFTLSPYGSADLGATRNSVAQSITLPQLFVRATASSSWVPPFIFRATASSAPTKAYACNCRCGGFGGGRFTPSDVDSRAASTSGAFQSSSPVSASGSFKPKYILLPPFTCECVILHLLPPPQLHRITVACCFFNDFPSLWVRIVAPL
ncbi:hypothetical protein PIB30_016373 [Stylosanthes scabra]|uniref:Uncharacterized protein n=1 Tax=Stylosanthes scabra TaxID=79078 RepID=A0ABU6T757_9FABA|nr:hypothetical protein [Stylosanthes scabra]